METVQQPRAKRNLWVYLRESAIRSVLLPKGADGVITASVFILALFGSVMIISTALGQTVSNPNGLISEIIKQAVFLLLGYVIMILTSKAFRFRWVNNTQLILMIVYFLVMFFTAVGGIEVNGSRAWISLGFTTIQPSEFGKPLLIVLLATSAWAAARSKARRNSFFEYFRMPILFVVLSIVFVGGLQHDYGSMAITLLIALTGFFVPRAPVLKKAQKWLLILALLAIVGIILVLVFADYVVPVLSKIPVISHIAVRIENMLDPYIDIHNNGYQPANALYAIADSGIFGRGLGRSVRKYGFLTQAESDYILAIVIEETGIFGLGLITIFYGLIIWRLLYWAMQANLTADRVLLICTGGYLTFHFFINVGGVSALLPMTGVPLLLISAGGSSLIAFAIAIGVAQNRIAAIKARKEQA